MTPRILTLSSASMAVPLKLSDGCFATFSFCHEKWTNPVLSASKIAPLLRAQDSALRMMVSLYRLSGDLRCGAGHPRGKIVNKAKGVSSDINLLLDQIGVIEDIRDRGQEEPLWVSSMALLSRSYVSS